MEENKNMELWNKVCETDPRITKKIEYGKRKFTAIDAQAQIKKATEIWGPYGSTWGVKNCVYTHIYSKDEPAEVMLTGVFYFPGGNFEIATDIAFKPGGECCKKLLTDLTTKALSKVGFNSDVFEGKFDGNRYTQTQNRSNTSKQYEKQRNNPKQMTGDATDPQINAIVKIAAKKEMSEPEVMNIMKWYANGETLSKQKASEMITGFDKIFENFLNKESASAN